MPHSTAKFLIFSIKCSIKYEIRNVPYSCMQSNKALPLPLPHSSFLRGKRERCLRLLRALPDSTATHRIRSSRRRRRRRRRHRPYGMLSSLIVSLIFCSFPFRFVEPKLGNVFTVLDFGQFISRFFFWILYCLCSRLTSENRECIWHPDFLFFFCSFLLMFAFGTNDWNINLGEDY